MTNKTYITFETKKNGTVDMTKDTFCRWLCLTEGLYIMEQKADKLGIDLKDRDWVKPLAFEKYIAERFEGMMLDLNYDEKNNLLGKKYIHHSNKPEYSESVVSTIS
jgi:hypothetical protein